MSTEKKHPRWHKPVNVLAYILLAVSYAVFLILFVLDNDFLDSTISRVTSLVNLAGALGFLTLREHLKKAWPVSLWIFTGAVFLATAFQAAALLPMHPLKVRVEVYRGPGSRSTVQARDLDVRLSSTYEKLSFDAADTIGDLIAFNFSSPHGNLKWNQDESVVAYLPQFQAADSQKVGWGSFWTLFDVASECEVMIGLTAGVVAVSVTTSPPDARINLVACDESGNEISLDTTFTGNTPIPVSLGEHLRIKCWRQGYYTATDNFDLKPVTGSVEIPISLSRRPATVTVEAYNVGGQPEPMAGVLIDFEETPHRAAQPFDLPWGYSYVIATSLVTPDGSRLQSQGKLLRIDSDPLDYNIKCTLELVR